MADKLTAVDFVRIYNGCNSLDEVVKKTGMKKGTIQARLSQYKEIEGVELKKFTAPRQRINRDELVNASKEYLAATVGDTTDASVNPGVQS